MLKVCKGYIAFCIAVLCIVSLVAMISFAPVSKSISAGLEEPSLNLKDNFHELSKCIERIESGFAQSKTRSNKIYIDRPAVLNKANSEYVLTADVDADGTAFTIAASNVTLNFGGHTIKYGFSGGQKQYGVLVEGYNHKDIQILNGTIVQGDKSRSVPECSPIMLPHEIKGVEITRMTLRWASPQASGIYAIWGDADFHDNILIDEGNVVLNRHQMVAAINIHRSSHANIKGNAIVRARQTGVAMGGQKSIFSDNVVFIDSKSTNSYGVSYYSSGGGWLCDGNVIKGVGVHPIGIGVISGASGGIVSRNTVDVQCTELSAEYGKTPIGAAAFRTTWGADNVKVVNNTFTVRGKKGLVDGHDSWGRSVWVAIKKGQSLVFENNMIRAVSPDPSVKVAGIAVTGNNESGGLIFSHNDVESTWATVLLADDYGVAGGYPLFIRNTFRKVGNNSDFRWFRDDYKDWTSTAFFIDNVLEGVDIGSCGLTWTSKDVKEVYFGKEITFDVKDKSGKSLSGIPVKINQKSSQEEISGVTNNSGLITLAVPFRVRGNRDEQGFNVGKMLDRLISPVTVTVGVVPQSQTMPIDEMSGPLIVFNLENAKQ